MFAAKYLAGAVCQQGETFFSGPGVPPASAPPGLEGMLDLKTLNLAACHAKAPAGAQQKKPGHGVPPGPFQATFQKLPERDADFVPPPSLPPRKQQGRGRVGERCVPPPEPFPTQDDVLCAVESLYADRVKPWGRILRKRLVERQFLKAGGRCTKQGREQLMHQIFMETEGVEAVCRKNPLFRVHMDETGEVGDWSVELVDRIPVFVDVHSPNDVYPEAMWAAARLFFASPAGQDLALPKSRYDCACYLAGLELPWLAQRTLGEVCHIVQLCISQKKLLGQKRGCLVAFEKSDSKAKEQRAVELLPCKDTNNGEHGPPVATWETLAAGLQRVLQKNPHIPLATLKQTFESSQSMKLSETALGYSKLSELLQDEHVQHVCQLQRESKGYFLVPVGVQEHTKMDNTASGSNSSSKKVSKSGKGGNQKSGKSSMPPEPKPAAQEVADAAYWRNAERFGPPMKLSTDFTNLEGPSPGLTLPEQVLYGQQLNGVFDSAGLGAHTFASPWLAQRLLMRHGSALV
mmetsp:Transcript_23152/g.42622  ORF Transcript_23152/g.42622 Transcript_23152/m.42622 type:complete len:518 (+) Transcript_23152:145-1698(+)